MTTSQIENLRIIEKEAIYDLFQKEYTLDVHKTTFIELANIERNLDNVRSFDLG